MGIPDNLSGHNRGYLPHYYASYAVTSITFRLYDSLPKQKLREWEEQHHAMTIHDKTKQEQARMEKIEEYLDRGEGLAWLKQERFAELVQDSLLFFANERYLLHAWVIMPNHVHALITPTKNNAVPTIVHSWKSYTSSTINKLLNTKGPFWQKEYFDRLIRGERHFRNSIEYIERNPVKAGLCFSPDQWRFSSATFDLDSRLVIGKG